MLRSSLVTSALLSALAASLLGASPEPALTSDDDVTIDVQAVDTRGVVLNRFHGDFKFGEKATFVAGITREEDTPPLFVGLRGSISVYGTTPLQVTNDIEYLGPRGYKGLRLQQHRVQYATTQTVESGKELLFKGDGISLLMTIARK